MHSVKHMPAVAAALSLTAAIFPFSSGARAANEADTTAAVATATRGPSSSPLPNGYAELPVAFVENRGQTDDRVRYYVQRSRSAFFLTPQGIVVSLREASDAPWPLESSRRAPGLPVPSARDLSITGVALALRFEDANPGVTIEAEDRVAGSVNYLRGHDSTGWHTELRRFAQVVYREVWPGIDLVLRARQAELKYEFRVRPGARPSDIRLSVAGAKGVTLDEGGALLIDTALGPLRDSPPVSWQEIDGARVPVKSRYVLAGADDAERSFAFGVDAYDPRYELVIDPDLDYSTFIGGSSMERAAGVAVDGDGNTYVVGTTQSTDFPAQAGSFDVTFNGGTADVFVAKLNATGSGLVYATYLGGVPTPLRRGTGDNVEFGRAITVDAGGHAYVAGITDSSDFPTTGGAFQPTLNATQDVAKDAFVVKLNPSGSGLVYSTFLGGSGHDEGWGIAVDSDGNAYVIGDTGSSDFPTTSGAAQVSLGGGRDAFVTALNAAGSALIYSTYLGGLDNEVGNGVFVGAAGQAFVAGGTRSADFPTTPAAFQPVHSGGAFDSLFDAFAARLNSTGGLVYSTFLGGTRIDIANDIAAGSDGSAYVLGSTSSPEFPTTEGAFDRTTGGGFVARLNADGSALVYSTFLGGGGKDAIALDANANAWITGTAGAGAPTTPGAFAEQNGGGSDAWLGQLSADGSAVLFATFIGGSNTDNGTGVALDTAGAVYMSGTTLSFDFPTTAGAFDTTFAGDPALFWGDAFVAKFGAGGGTVNPEPERTTSTFSGRLDKNQAAFHSVDIGAAGAVDLSLDWTDDTRANLTLRVRDPAGTEVFFDGSAAKPKIGTFDATTTGSYGMEVANVSDRRATYTLSVTYPVGSSQSGGVSFVALDPETVTGGSSSTGTVALTVGAPAGGAVVALASSNEAAATVPASVTVPEGLTTATFSVLTNSVSANTTSTISATYNGSTRSATLGVNAADGPALSTLTLDPQTVAGGSASAGTVTLTGAAPAGGAVVTLVSSNTETATVPPSVTVPEGSTTATFTVSTNQVSFDSSSAISASHGGATQTVILSVTASGTSTAALSSLALDPTTVTAGGSSTGTVTLTSAAPAGGFVVSLTSSDSAATVPASVTVAEGATSATFGIGTTAVTASTTATITATADGVTRSATLTITPQTDSATLTVTATGRTGERVLSDPAGIDVSVGSTGSASFPVGTVITLSVTDQRDAIWSGACSSGGEKERTCAFTLNGDASVTVDVN